MCIAGVSPELALTQPPSLRFSSYPFGCVCAASQHECMVMCMVPYMQLRGAPPCALSAWSPTQLQLSAWQLDLHTCPLSPVAPYRAHWPGRWRRTAAPVGCKWRRAGHAGARCEIASREVESLNACRCAAKTHQTSNKRNQAHGDWRQGRGKRNDAESINVSKRSPHFETRYWIS